MSLNHVVLIGRLVADPELRTTSSGISVTSFTIAVDRRFKNQQGERETDFIDIVAWRKTADLVSQYCTKGMKVAVDGSLQVRSYEAKDGSKRKAYEIVAENVQFLDRGGQSGTRSASSDVPPPDDAPPPPGMGGDEDDDLPF